MPQTSIEAMYVGLEAHARAGPHLAATHQQLKHEVFCTSVARSSGASFYRSFYETAVRQGETFGKACKGQN